MNEISIVNYYEKQYPNLCWALNSNSDLETIIFGEYGNNKRYLSQLEDLVSDLKTLNCKGIQEEIKDISDFNKFLAATSELEISLIMSKKGYSSEMLPDNIFKGQSPDILCQNGTHTLFVEVTRLNENPYISDIIVNHLKDFLSNSPYMVNARLKNDLSIPKVKGSDRIKQKEMVELSLNEFDEIFKKDNFSSFPFKVDTKYITFEIIKIDSTKGYSGMISSECIKIPADDLRDYVKERLMKKANKRNDFESRYQTYPYILAFDCKQMFIDEDDLDNLLYGIDGSIATFPTILSKSDEQRCKIWKDDEFKKVVDTIRQKDSWKEIEAVKADGLDNLLLEKKIIPNDYSYRSDEGLFLSEPFMKNVSGVLFKDTSNSVFYFPNPFCYKEIRYQSL